MRYNLFGLYVLFPVAIGRFGTKPLPALRLYFFDGAYLFLVSLAWSSLAQLRIGLKSLLLSTRESTLSLTAINRTPFSGK